MVVMFNLKEQILKQDQCEIIIRKPLWARLCYGGGFLLFGGMLVYTLIGIFSKPKSFAPPAMDDLKTILFALVACAPVLWACFTVNITAKLFWTDHTYQITYGFWPMQKNIRGPLMDINHLYIQERYLSNSRDSVTIAYNLTIAWSPTPTTTFQIIKWQRKRADTVFAISECRIEAADLASEISRRTGAPFIGTFLRD